MRRAATSSRGSIPAGAGEPWGEATEPPYARVYPRGCGGAIAEKLGVSKRTGLSPRVRGSLVPWQAHGLRLGSIPAGAGEPRQGGGAPRAQWVYPRGCGGAGLQRLGMVARVGLSPRVRGSRPRTAMMRSSTGSIPAGAGEPAGTGCSETTRAVYPRGCGGAKVGGEPEAQERGLSPRVRGSPGRLVAGASERGSIPAGAGEPTWPGGCSRLSGVYPRGCGGADLARWMLETEWGLSPRVRGSPRCPYVIVFHRGSIPAGAGEPHGNSLEVSREWVYPRGCGGATAAERFQVRIPGLSPRVRGSLSAFVSVTVNVGSIPAGAGEPNPPASRRRWWWVYPRGCGGATSTGRGNLRCPGLSPRVRGSRSDRVAERSTAGSIPAGAGEPLELRAGGWDEPVYPRGCGGAAFKSASGGVLTGLSPRVRGSHGPGRAARPGRGSIPAGAGEPTSTRSRSGPRRVYPRGCGGAWYYRRAP